ncbi:NAD-dependent epimerase/dehydratase family protein [Mycobacterium antarcticum]|uniref:NAD-dependent epimerase/dehydratase family protein n=1 Tax=Mycolicibacterium sp. TUM20984 TaxID=3023368 RepID=UPI0023A32916|nr:NAD-dependent epimerase/dehydratase family protein [Mycolicibacterium sp. TUM20984]GLP82741.1 hypothetical protein TUM20984_41610 [Mycolicibacterium sp. TUM20984]
MSDLPTDAFGMAEPRRVVVTGASGNVGAGVLRALARELPNAEVIGVCRRPPTTGQVYERVGWHAVDLSAPTATADLEPAMRGADVVIHLALAVHPVRDEEYLYRANVVGSQAVFDAMADAGIRQLVYASSLGIYAPGSTAPVSESWATTGQPTSIYSRHKVAVESLLDRFEAEHPDTVVARFRPTVVVQRETASMIRSLYVGPLVPRLAYDLVRRAGVPVLPLPAGLALQFVHADDVGDAVIQLIRRRVRGSYNVAADALDAEALAALVKARPVDVDAPFMRTVITTLSRLRLIALTPGWYDVAMNSPVMDTSKARRDLDWSPSRSSAEGALELLDGLAEGATGTSAAMGFEDGDGMDGQVLMRRVHDASLLLWCALAVARASGKGRAGIPDAAVIGTNLVAGTPMALDRLRERRRDPVALLAPAAVGAAVLSTLRGGWAPVAATTVLGMLAMAERRRATT